MIKVIASDLDGTLLDNNHEITEETFRAIELAKEQGIRFIITTGRSFKNAMKVLKNYKFDWDYIVASGAEIRDYKARIIKQVPMDQSVFEELYQRIKRFSVGVNFCSDEYDYLIGTQEEVREELIEQAILFHMTGTREEIANSAEFKSMFDKIRCIQDINELRKLDIPIFKIFISSSNESLIRDIDKAIADIPGIASASSFASNLELTHIEAQKGIALTEYTRQLGYNMEEVMVLGDSMNDYSMLSLDFGVTVAMENAMEEVKKVAKYITKSNSQNGVAFAIHKLLNQQLDEIKKD